METHPQPSLPQPQDSAQPVSWKIILLGVLILYGILFVFFNTGKIKIDFVLFSANISTVFALLLMGIAGFAGGLFFDRVRERRKQSSSSSSDSSIS